jgi:hypothetical protein
MTGGSTPGLNHAALVRIITERDAFVLYYAYPLTRLIKF